MAALASARSPQAEVPPRQNSLQMAEEEDTSTLKLKHLSEAIAMLTDPKVTTVTDILIMYRHIYLHSDFCSITSMSTLSAQSF